MAARPALPRIDEQHRLRRIFEVFPAVALLGARRVGKSTLAGMLDAQHRFDPENPRDLVRFNTPQLTLEGSTG